MGSITRLRPKKARKRRQYYLALVEGTADMREVTEGVVGVLHRKDGRGQCHIASDMPEHELATGDATARRIASGAGWVLWTDDPETRGLDLEIRTALRELEDRRGRRPGPVIVKPGSSIA